MGRRILLAVLVLLAAASAAQAQGNGRIVGRVVSAEGDRPIKSRAGRNWNGASCPVLNCTTSGSTILTVPPSHPYERQRPQRPHFSCLTETCQPEVTGRGSAESPVTVPSDNGPHREISRRVHQQVFSRCHRLCRPAVRRLSTGRQLPELFGIRSGSMTLHPEFLPLSLPFVRSQAICRHS